MPNLISQKIKDELRQLGIEPKKSLGQNFLVNEGVYKKIVAALEIKRSDIIIEVGPGLGTLTGYLAESGARVIAIEKDEKLAAYLRNKFSNRKNVKIIEGDVLKFSPENWKLETGNPDARSGPRLERRGYKLVGNIPYYLTSRLIRNILEDWPLPKLVVLMVQKEVAQRICAKPPEMSLLALSVQYYTTPKIVSYVSGGSFMPPPDVDSAIIRLVPSEQFTAYSDNAENCKRFDRLEPLGGEPRDEPLTVERLKTVNFFKVARAGFSGKRKQLLNSLSGGLKKNKEEIEEKLKLSNIDPKRRAETLTIEEWQKITNSLFPQD